MTSQTLTMGEWLVLNVGVEFPYGTLMFNEDGFLPGVRFGSWDMRGHRLHPFTALRWPA